MTDLYSVVKSGLKKQLEESIYKPTVLSLPKGDEFPKVVIEDITNIESGSDFGRMNTFSSVVYEINIYAKNINGKSERTIANEIRRHVQKYMEDVMSFKRVYCSPTPNVDTSVYRITLRYQVLINDYRNKFI